MAAVSALVRWMPQRSMSTKPTSRQPKAAPTVFKP